MPKIMCQCCAGSGKIMGGGMIMRDCDECSGAGSIIEADDDIEYLQLKATDSYKDAIQKIKKVDPELSTEDAEEIFKKELVSLRDEKIDKKDRKKKIHG